MKLHILTGRYAICRMPRENPIPSWFPGHPEFINITYTADELSIVCLEGNVPVSVTQEKGWRVLKVEGPLDLAMTGVIASLSSLLAAAGVSIFSVSTYDTDYLLVKEERLEQAKEVLRQAGFEVE
jgi:hypothetical protein